MLESLELGTAGNRLKFYASYSEKSRIILPRHISLISISPPQQQPEPPSAVISRGRARITNPILGREDMRGGGARGTIQSATFGCAKQHHLYAKDLTLNASATREMEGERVRRCHLM